MNKKLNISIIGTRGYPYIYSGYETFVKELSERLTLKDCNVTVYCHKGLFKKRPKEINGTIVWWQHVGRIVAIGRETIKH